MSFQSETTNSGLSSVAVLVARVFISILFILAGWGKLTAIGGTAGYFGSIGLPMPTVTAVIVGLIEFLGGIAILVGFQTRLAAIVVALFTLGATLVAHMDFSEGMNALMAQKNLAIAGGLLALAAFGAGSYSVDSKLR